MPVDAEAVARELVARGVAPDVAAGSACDGSQGFDLDEGGARATFFDLASLTKPMTALAALRAGLPIDAPLRAILPELTGAAAGEATLDALLSHRAGLAAHVALHEPLLRGTLAAGDALRVAAEARRPECQGPVPPEGFPPVYSDVGYLLVGAALARHTGAADAGEAIEELVARPLGIPVDLGTARRLEVASPGWASRVAPTEDVAWRGGVVRGRVHDENAWALTGAGGAGHAGMFGTLHAVLVFACAVLDGLSSRGPFAGDDVDRLVRPRPGGSLRAGFDGKSPNGSSAGASFGPRSFGHLGFTGTSVWIDPDARIVAAVLTNRVHPTRENTRLREARPWAHEALFQSARSRRR